MATPLEIFSDGVGALRVKTRTLMAVFLFIVLPTNTHDNWKILYNIRYYEYIPIYTTNAR